MTMTEYDIQRISRSVVDMLLGDERFVSRMERLFSKKSQRLLNSRQAGQRLGISADTVRDIAPYIGGIKKGDGKQCQWAFEEDGLKERYIDYISSK